MEEENKGSISVFKIIAVTLLLVFIFGISSMATEIDLKSVEIIMPNGYVMTVVTAKKNVEEILKDNNVFLEQDERVCPKLDEEIDSNNKIVITNKSEQEVQIAKISESGSETTIDEILQGYSPIVEKIIVEQENIPYETITKDVSKGSQDKKNRVIQSGEDGIKEVTYKVKYQNDEILEKIKLGEKIIKEPVNKIVQVQKNVITSRAGKTYSNTGDVKIYKVTAYCPCAKCCGKRTGITASGARATANHTVAASGALPFGTKLLINGKEYTVEDRGGAIKGNRIDVFMNTHQEALSWGVKYLPVKVVE